MYQFNKGFDDVYPLDRDISVTYLDPCQSVQQVIQSNQKREKEEPPSNIFIRLSQCTEIGEYMRCVEEEIELSMRTRSYVPAYRFFADATELVPGASSHTIRVVDVVNFRRTPEETSFVPLPLHYHHLFEKSGEDIARFERFVKSVDLFIYTAVTVVMKVADTFIECLTEFLDEEDRLTDAVHEGIEGKIADLDAFCARVEDYEDELQEKFRFLRISGRELEKWRHVLEKSSCRSDVPMKILRLRDFFYYSLEEYEKCLLKATGLMSEIFE